MPKDMDFKQQVMKALGLLCPADIALMAKISTGVKKIKLTEIMRTGDEPLYLEKEKPSETFATNGELVQFPAEAVTESKEEKEEVVQKIEKETNQRPSATILIFEERKKMAEATKKMREVEVLLAYEESAAVDLDYEKKQGKKAGEVAGRGILVNKKQA